MEQQFEPPSAEVRWAAPPSQSRSLEEQEQIKRDLNTQKVNRLLTTLREEALKRRKQRRNAAIGLTLYFSIIIGTIIIVTFTTGKFPASMLGSMGSMTGVIAVTFAVSQKQKEATKKIAEFDDIRAVGPLLDALDFQDNETRKIAERALIRLLPRLQASDSSLLSSDQQGLLVKTLGCKEISLSLAALKALEQIGDERALPVVEQLARGEGRAANVSALQQAAQECLPALTALAERKRASRELLRAANGNLTPQEVLLRPVTTQQSATDPALLLRADNTGETRK